MLNEKSMKRLKVVFQVVYAMKAFNEIMKCISTWHVLSGPNFFHGAKLLLEFDILKQWSCCIIIILTEITFLRTVQNPLYCTVAPKKESSKLPPSPARVARGITSSCFRATSGQLAVINPIKTNSSPITQPPAAAAKSPVFVTPPFVPLRTS